MRREIADWMTFTGWSRGPRWACLLDGLPVSCAEVSGHLRNERFGDVVRLAAAVGRQCVDVDSGRLLGNHRMNEDLVKGSSEADQPVVLHDDGAGVVVHDLDHTLADIRRASLAVARHRHPRTEHE